MYYLIGQYWIWLAVALVFGGVVVWRSRLRGAGSLSSSWLAWGAAVFAAGLAVALSGAVAGRPGLYLETALLLLAAYGAGGVLVSAFGNAWPTQYKGWWGGLVLLALIWIFSNISTESGIKQDIRARTAGVVARAGGDPLNLDVAGRDVLLPVDAGTSDRRQEWKTLLLALPGVRRVSDVSGLTGAAAEMRANALAEKAAQQAAAEKVAREAAATAAAEKAAQEAAAKVAAEKAAQEAAARAAAEKAAQEAAARAAAEKAAQEAAAKAAAEKVAQEAAAKASAEKAVQEAAARAAADKAAQEAAARAAAEKTAQEAAAKAAAEKSAQEAAAKAAAEKSAQEAAARAAAEKSAQEAAARAAAPRNRRRKPPPAPRPKKPRRTPPQRPRGVRRSCLN